MKVILVEDVKALGKKGEMVNVSDGYARNMLFPKKLALEASAKNINDLKLKKAHDEKVAKEQLADARAFAEELAKMEKICPHFHLSLQSGCDATLARMNRKYTTEEYENACSILRKNFTHPAITTDVIVGFPGETEEEFEETRKFLEEIDLYEMHVFKYSIRKGTKAADMKPQINDQIKAKRSNVLLEMSKQHQKEFETKQLGMVKEVLIEEKMHGKDHYYTGHTKEYIKVALYSEELLENKIVKVKLRQILDDGYVLAEC